MTDQYKLACPECDIHIIKLYKVSNKKVCRLCKKDYLKYGFFLRKKVKHDYRGANEYVYELWQIHNKKYKINKQKK